MPSASSTGVPREILIGSANSSKLDPPKPGRGGAKSATGMSRPREQRPRPQVRSELPDGSCRARLAVAIRLPGHALRHVRFGRIDVSGRGKRGQARMHRLRGSHRLLVIRNRERGPLRSLGWTHGRGAAAVATKMARGSANGHWRAFAAVIHEADRRCQSSFEECSDGLERSLAGANRHQPATHHVIRLGQEPVRGPRSSRQHPRDRRRDGPDRR